MKAIICFEKLPYIALQDLSKITFHLTNMHEVFKNHFSRMIRMLYGNFLAPSLHHKCEATMDLRLSARNTRL